MPQASSKLRCRQFFRKSFFATSCFSTLLCGEQAWTSNFNLKSFVMDSVQVGKASFVKENQTTLGIEPRTYSYPGRLVTILLSAGLVFKLS